MSSISPNGPGRTLSNPASRSTRFSRIGRLTSTWPYSLTTHTRAPTCLAASSNGATGVVQLADEARHVAAGGTESLGVVIEVRQVDQASARAALARGPRRRSGRSIAVQGAPAFGPQKVWNGKRPEVALEPLAQPVGRRR